MKTGDKVYCINNIEEGIKRNLTIGKWYKIDNTTLFDDHKNVVIVNNSGNRFLYSTNLFITEKELRKQKLNKLQSCSK